MNFNLNDPNTSLKDLILIEKNAISNEVCDTVVETVKKGEWQPHQWYNSSQNASHSEETKELDIQFGSMESELQNLINPFMMKTGESYLRKYAYLEYERTRQIVDRFSPLRFNRYQAGQIMRQHIDHIHSLYDGTIKGIPVLSFILNFNDDYKGGDLYFWDKHKVKLGKGDIVIFPSLFLFPHRVSELLIGERYSGVCWAW